MGGLSPSVTRVLGYRLIIVNMVGGWVKNGRFWRYVIMQWPLSVSLWSFSVSFRPLSVFMATGLIVFY